MPNRLIGSIFLLAALAFPSLVGAQQQAAAKASAAPPDLSGVWTMQNGPGARYFSYTFSAQEPSMTPWAEERFKLNKPSFGPRAVEIRLHAGDDRHARALRQEHARAGEPDTLRSAGYQHGLSA